MHVTKVYFILKILKVLKIKYVEFEDKPNNFYFKQEGWLSPTERASAG